MRRNERQREWESGQAPRRNALNQVLDSLHGRIHMTYLLMIYLDEAGWPKLTKAEQDQGTAAYQAYFEALEKEGAFKGANRLQPSTTATTVHVANGKRVVTDGPYAETKEQLGGYFLINAPDLDSAVAWAARCPGASHGFVEVRPIWQMPM